MGFVAYAKVMVKVISIQSFSTGEYDLGNLYTKYEHCYCCYSVQVMNLTLRGWMLQFISNQWPLGVSVISGKPEVHPKTF